MAEKKEEKPETTSSIPALITQPTCPSNQECFPLKSFEDFINWKPTCIPKALSENIVPLASHHFYPGRKTLFCHDMRGGYLEDRFVEGHDNHKAYRFFHWSNIDMFIYFSHNFVTIPPITWINAAHINGTLILGTVITEYESGFELCKQLLASEENCQKVCDILVDIAKHYKLDGWLINIENNVQSHLITRLLHCLESLKEKIEKHIPHGKLLWYDSVVSSGSVSYQNMLNEQNLAFFKATHGIFLNYNWNDTKLKSSHDLAKSFGRLNDVYVGIDVFGRGCHGGGGWNTHLAVEKARQHDLSMSIFAPGWVLENLGEDGFDNNQIKFWSKLKLGTRHVPEQLPFATNFCQGFGKAKYDNGQKISSKPWFNMNLTSPTTRNYEENEIYLEDAFDGGQSIWMIDWEEPILHCYFDMRLSLDIHLIYKLEPSASKSPEVNLIVEFHAKRSDEAAYPKQSSSHKVVHSYQPATQVGDDSDSQWLSSRYSLEPSDHHILTAIKVKPVILTKGESKFLVGALRIKNLHQPSVVFMDFNRIYSVHWTAPTCGQI